jgi:hypothetical protein
MDYPAAKDPEAVESMADRLVRDEFTARKEIADLMWISFGKGFSHHPIKSVENYKNFLECADEILDILRNK